MCDSVSISFEIDIGQSGFFFMLMPTIILLHEYPIYIYIYIYRVSNKTIMYNIGYDYLSEPGRTRK